jgi:hypothetical protein
VRTSGIIFEGPDSFGDVHKSAGVNPTGSQLPASGIVPCPSKPHVSSFVGGSSSFLSPSTDEEDLFGVPQDLPSEYGNSKDDDRSLFSCAPVLSPLEPFAKVPADNSLPKYAAIDMLNGSKLLEDSVDEDAIVAAGHSSSNEDSTSVSNISGGNRDICEIQPPPEVSQDIETKKIEPFSGTERQEHSASYTLFTSVGPIPEPNASYTTVGKTGHSSDSPQAADSSLKNCLSSKDPFFLDGGTSSIPENIQQSEPHEELFTAGSVKHTDDVSSSRKGPAEVLDDLFSTERIHKSILSDNISAAAADDDDDLFSSDTKKLKSNNIKKRTSLIKSVVIEPKKVYDVQDDVPFLSGDGQKQSLPAGKDLLSKNIKDVNKPGSNYSMFGTDIPECDDPLFVATSAKKSDKSAIKGTVASSTKSYLFDEDDGDDLFGSVKSTSKSALSAKPMNSEG